jgi:hypothetical protein
MIITMRFYVVASFLHPFWAFLAHGSPSHGFLILVKEQRLQSNPIQWIRDFACREMLYILLYLFFRVNLVFY